MCPSRKNWRFQRTLKWDYNKIMIKIHVRCNYIKIFIRSEAENSKKSRKLWNHSWNTCIYVFMCLYLCLYMNEIRSDHKVNITIQIIAFVNFYFWITNESPFWLGGHGSLLVVPANVVFHWMSSENSLLHLFCSVFDRQIRHLNW